MTFNNIEEALSGFEANLKELNRSEQTIKTYVTAATKLCTWMKAQQLTQAKELTPKVIGNFQGTYSEEAEKLSYSPETIHTHLRGIKRFLEYLEKTHQLLIGPSDTIQMPKLWRHRTVKEILTPEEIKKMIECWDRSNRYGARSRALLELLYSTGLRRGELIHLDIDDIDLKGGYLRVRLGKGGKDRIQPLGRRACKEIKHYTEKARLELLKDAQERALFLDRTGQRLDGWRIYQTLQESAKRTGLTKKPSIHMIRRTFATHLLRNDAHPVYVKEMLGHSSLTTLDRYIKLSGIDLKKEHTRTHPREK